MNGVLVCSGTYKTKNIGDYIQSVAQEQFWDHTDIFVERESMNTLECDEQINLIMNGWYMWNPQNFPPAECINPLFISIHINPKIAEDFFTTETVNYLKKYEPIGARDKGTQVLLEKYGIKSYFSSCLTLTLGMKYKNLEKNEKIVFVDPYIFRKETPIQIIISLLKSVIYLVEHPVKTVKLARKTNFRFSRISDISKTLDRYLHVASFYHLYRQLFSDDFLFNAEFVTHNVDNISITDEQKMEIARDLIKLYSGARLVVTSRIHAALPCLGIETPVIFIPSKGLDATRMNAGRFDGLDDLFNVIRWQNNKLVIESNEIKKQLKDGKIQRDIQVCNPLDYVRYRDELINRVSNWCKNIKL